MNGEISTGDGPGNELQGRPRRLEQLVTEINQRQGMIQTAVHAALRHAAVAGEALVEAKAQLPHGQWLSWLGDNCPSISPRSAQLYMRIARSWSFLESNTQDIAHLTLTGAEGLLATARRQSDRWPEEMPPPGKALAAETSAGIFILVEPLEEAGYFFITCLPIREDDDRPVLFNSSGLGRDGVQHLFNMWDDEFQFGEVGEWRVIEREPHRGRYHPLHQPYWLCHQTGDSGLDKLEATIFDRKSDPNDVHRAIAHIAKEGLFRRFDTTLADYLKSRFERSDEVVHQWCKEASRLLNAEK